MRISSQQVFNGGVNRLQDLNTQLQQTQQQISTGKRVINPSDDPVAAARILKLNQETAQIDQFQRGIDLAENRLEQEESTLSDITDVIQRVRELTVQAGNGSLSADDRRSISSELKERLDQLAGLTNTRDASGEYIFSGFKGNTPAFSKDESGNWVYQGDEGQRKLEIDNGVNVAINDPGKGIFVDIESSDSTFSTSASSRNSDVSAQLGNEFIYDQEAFNEVYPDDLMIEIDSTSPNGFMVTNRSTGEELVPDDVAGSTVRVAGVQFDIPAAGNTADGDQFFVNSGQKQSMFDTVQKLISGLDSQMKGAASASVTSFAPNNGDVLSINGVSVPETGTFSGTETTADLRDQINSNTELKSQGITASLDVDSGELRIQSQGGDISISALDDSDPPAQTYSGGLTVTGAAADDLDVAGGVLAANYKGGQQAYDDLIARSLENLDNAQESILTTQTTIGGRLNAVESTRDFLSDSSVYTEKITSELQDVDYAEAVSRLSFQSFVLQAAQQSFAQVSQLSLFDRI